MQTIEARFEIVTPMFIGGGNPDEVELRPPSIKGALRFWWRALHWGQCLGIQNNNISDALTLLHEREAALFGAAANDDKYGQGKLQIRLTLEENLREYPRPTNLPSGQAYLLGQGLYHFDNGLLKKALDANQHFTIHLKLANDVKPEPVLNTLLIWGLLGGLGSRSRKGWGSVAIRSLIYKKSLGEDGRAIEVPDTTNTYKTKVQELLMDLAPCLPPFTAFSKKTRIDLSKIGNNALTLLGGIGQEMQMYRSYGRRDRQGNHVVGNQPAEQNFGNDHDLILDFFGHRSITTHPERVIFGLPHNYFFSNGAKVDVHAVDATTGSEHRRSSPLFIHIHKFTSGDCIAVQSLLKANFLPATDKIQLKAKTALNLACSVDWNVINQYLDRFNTKETII
ncbi:type III-B CRISPR module RAMP protein Cmr1 [Methylovulum psychrotolerans]|uniref:Type III-B CRISPR module RAMP protein Cmr1 n=1 Tax=Methylovulum psychrotolerans TaxID=1704499 RepID=A0A1Z4BYQ4_9GAMM|nr:type III-B CRISPR module RAMP protein Cmr1 [Methylovulum psychrotolerans]ASF46389.1 type III-B CRISPR module RAMP protein Cmr1 [Methylovulum psychrotolerans]